MRHYLPDGQYVSEGSPFTFNDVQYPSNWLQFATAEDKARIGIEPVQAVNERANDYYYDVSEAVVGSTLTYINTPKDLAMCLKRAVDGINQTAYSLLQPSDWKVTRAYEQGIPLSAPWASFRQSIRDTANLAIEAVTACASVADLEALPAIQWPHDPNYVAPVIEETPVNV